MNRYTALLLGAFTLGGLLGMVTGLYLAAHWIEQEYRAKYRADSAAVKDAMRNNQMCVKAWKKTPECVDWN